MQEEKQGLPVAQLVAEVAAAQAVLSKQEAE